MGRILISNLAPLGEHDIEFFSNFIGALEGLGQTCFLWSGPYNREFVKYHIPMDWNIGNWREQLQFSEEDYESGIQFVDQPEKWIARISLLIKQGEVASEPSELFRIIVSFSHRLLTKVEPNLFLVWNTLCPHGGIGREIAGGLNIPSMLLERGNFPNTWFLEKGGLVGHSVLVDRPLTQLVKPWEYEGFEIVGRNFLNSWGKDSPLKYEQKSASGEESVVLNQSLPGKKIVFFPPDDVSLGFLPAEHEDRKKHLPGFVNSYEAALALARHSDGITVFKPHPSFGDWDLPSVEAEHFYVMNVDYRELVEWADVVATSGSGLQFYALSRGKPVISVARDLMTGKGIVYEALHEHDIGAVLKSMTLTGDSERQKNLLVFLGYLLTRYLISNQNTPDCFRKPHQAAEDLVLELGPSSEPVLRFDEVQALREDLVNNSLVRKWSHQYARLVALSEKTQEQRYSVSHSDLRNTLEDATEADTILLDFDHTLFFSNSTELYLDKCRPKWLVFFLTRISDYICKKLRLRPERWRDYARVHFISIVTPWNLLLWLLLSRRLWKQFGNEVLAGLVSGTSARLIVVSNGFSFLINPLLRNMERSSELLAGRFLQDRKSVCVRGKLASFRERYKDLDPRKSIFVTDSIGDKDMLDACGKSFLIQWGDYKFKAFRNFYFPFRYYAEAKYPSRNFVMRQLIGEDFVLLLLGYALVFESLASLVLLFLSLMSLYEVGYYWNDFKTLSSEKTPRISREARNFLNYPMFPWAFLFSGGTGIAGLYLGGVLDLEHGLLWLGILSGMLISFFAFNHLNELNRKYLFPWLHACKLFAYVPFFGFSPIGLPLFFSQLVTQLTIYNVYRHHGKVELFGRQRYRLAVFPLLFGLFLGFGYLDASPTLLTLYSALAVFWMAYRAITEKYGPLSNLMSWKK